MNCDYFWLTRDQFARLKPLLPTDTRGKPRVDERRVISGIVHVVKSGGRWVDAPAVYGGRKTLYNRFVRWAEKGIWIDMFHALAAAGGPPAQVLIDSSAVKAQRCAAGGKGGAQSGDRALARRTHHEDPRPERYGLSAHRLDADGRPSRPIAPPQSCCCGGCRKRRSFMATRATTAMPSADRSRAKVRCPIFRRRLIGVGRTASPRSSIETEMPSNACSVGSRTSAASRHDTTDPQPTSSPPSASLLASATGYEFLTLN